MRIKVELSPDSPMEYEAISLIATAAAGEIQQEPVIPNNTFSMDGVEFARTLTLLYAIKSVIGTAKDHERSRT